MVCNKAIHTQNCNNSNANEFIDSRAVVLDTDSRNIPVGDAERRVDECLKVQENAGIDHMFICMHILVAYIRTDLNTYILVHVLSTCKYNFLSKATFCVRT